MKPIWWLVRIQLRTVFDFNLIPRNKKVKKKKNYIFIAAVLSFVLMLSGTSFLYSYAIGISLKMIGATDLLPELMMAFTSVITIMTTIYKVKGTLFGFKDYDLVMSLPVKTSTVVASRLILLYGLNIVFTLIVMLPAAVAYGILTKTPPYFYAVSLLTVFFIPVIPMITAAVIGTVIAVIASKFRHSNLINVVITFAFLGCIIVIFAVFSLMTGNSEEALGQMSAALIMQVDRIYPLTGMYRRAVCGFNPTSVLLFLFLSILAFVLFSLIVGLNFKSINTNIAASRTKANYKIGNLEQASPFAALYRKELRRYFSSGLYVMNTAFGIVMMTVGAVATLFMSGDTLEQVINVPRAAQLIGALTPALVSFCVNMTFITACSISLEGKNLWILKAAPVPAGAIFLSKISANLTITLPAILIDGILFAVGLKLSLAEGLMLLLMPTAYAFFTAVFGLVINLHFPNLNWSTEVTVIKQSAATLIATFGGMIAAFLPVALLFGLPDMDNLFTNGLATLIIAAAALFMYRYLNTKGEKMFQAL